MKRKETLRERFIKKQKTSEPYTHFPIKDKQPETRITKRVVLMS
jgi:hypothetical protein